MKISRDGEGGGGLEGSRGEGEGRRGEGRAGREGRAVGGGRGGEDRGRRDTSSHKDKLVVKEDLSRVEVSRRSVEGQKVSRRLLEGR